ncbi:NXPE family member 3-like isoform X3 [Gouania willdenowi]|uniref:NXPE family member 3-like isoform X3 n=1 Tax=Gouania willdenowi TaxID=441366 RepID=UPI001056DBB3|nr:NXPE family member 3-like isoform X3 [Gouania willdenowi]
MPSAVVAEEKGFQRLDPVEVLHCSQRPPTMIEQSFRSPKVKAIFLPKCGFIFLCLTGCLIIFILWWMDNVEVQKTADPPFISQLLPINMSFCAFRPISLEETLEENKILKSIAWPQTPTITSDYTFKNTTDPWCSKFAILPKKGEEKWRIGDQLEVRIVMNDFKCLPKTSGGDVLLASVKNRHLKAGVSGKVVDHLNGNYTAVFPLVWEGKAEIEVILVHPGEAVTVLKRLNGENADRVYFNSTFRSGSVTETTVCNVCLRPTTQPVCNYTDIRTGEPWFCLKPKSLSCNTRIEHSKGGYLHPLTNQENKLFKKKINLRVPVQSSGSSSVTVYQQNKDKPTVTSSMFRPSGFYYKGVWKSLGTIQVHQFDTPSIVQCLRGKVVHLYGDSTMRQWFEYLTKELPDLKEFTLHIDKGTGPFMSLDYKNNILVTYRCHGPPIRFKPISVSELRYIANELDNIKGGSNTVVAFTIWAHLGTFPMKIYIRRLMSIRSAVLRLLLRAPDTLVVIRNGNPQALSTSISIFNSDWYSLQCNKVLRAVFKGMNVHLVDAWEMVLAHQLPHNLHPEPPIIKNMINVLLSYTCPQTQTK